MSRTKRPIGTRSRMVATLITGLALMWGLRLISAWADHTVAFITFFLVVLAFLLLLDWLLASFVPGLWRFTHSVSVSVGHALREDTEVRVLVERHPRFFGWLGDRFSTEKATGLYLTVTAATALYFFSEFVSVALSLALSRAITDYDPQILALFRAFRTPTLPVWVATASFDSWLEIGSAIPLPTHHIEPNIDAEQAYVVADLLGTGHAAFIARVRIAEPSTGTNAQGDQWFTQGYASVLKATR